MGEKFSQKQLHRFTFKRSVIKRSQRPLSFGKRAICLCSSDLPFSIPFLFLLSLSSLLLYKASNDLYGISICIHTTKKRDHIIRTLSRQTSVTLAERLSWAFPDDLTFRETIMPLPDAEEQRQSSSIGGFSEPRVLDIGSSGPDSNVQGHHF